MGKKVFILQVFFLCFIVAYHVDASERSWEYKDWSVSSDDKYVRYITNGDIVHGHQFGFIKKVENCNENLLWITWSTYEKGIEDFKGREATIQLRVDDTKFQIKIKIISVYQFTPNLTVIAFSNFVANKKLISLLKKGQKIEVTLIEPKELVNKLDIKTDTFSLNGFIATMLKSKEFCKVYKLATSKANIEIVRKAAEQGEVYAQYNLGLLYENGSGISQDHEQAIYWYKKSAEQGYADAQYNLGFMHEKGLGIAQNDRKAAYWYKKAAEQGHEWAQQNNLLMSDKFCFLDDYIKSKSYLDPFTIGNNYLFEGEGHDALEYYGNISVYSICDRYSSIKKVTEIEGTGHQLFYIHFQDGLLYVVHDRENRAKGNVFKIFDAKDIEKIKILSETIIIDEDSDITLVDAITIDQKYAYILFDKKLLFLNIEDPKKTIFDGKITINHNQFFNDEIAVDRNNLYITGNKDLVIIDKKMRKIVARKSFESRTGSIQVKDSIVYMEGWNNGNKFNGLILIDVSIPKSPRVVRSRETGSINSINIIKDHLFVIGFSSGRSTTPLQIFDISNPQNQQQTISTSDNVSEIQSKMENVESSLKGTKYSPDDLKALDELSENLYSWQYQEGDKGFMLALDFPYPSPFNPIDALSLTVFKLKAKPRPGFSIAVSKSVNKSKGFLIYFGKFDEQSGKINITGINIKNPVIPEDMGDYLILTFNDMYLLLDDGRVDLLYQMLNNEFIFFVFYNLDGTQYDVSYPLFKFQEQYKSIEGF